MTNNNKSLQELLNKWDKGKVKYKLAKDALAILRECYINDYGYDQITQAIEKVESIGVMTSEMASYVFRIVDKIPGKSVENYLKLVERVFANNSCTPHEANKVYSGMIDLINEQLNNARFYKRVLRIIDKELCGDVEALPSGHPYINKTGIVFIWIGGKENEWRQDNIKLSY